MKKRLLTLILAVLMAGFGTLACTDSKYKKINLAVVTDSIFYAPLYVAINKGFFEEEGLKINLTNSQGAHNVMSALTSSSAHIGLMGPEATVYVNQQGKKDYPLVFGQLTKRDGSFLMSKVDEAETFEWTNLTNKRAIIGRGGGMPAMVFEYIVNQHGLEHGTNINLDRNTEFAMLAQVFDSEAGVNYTALFEPLASTMAMQGKGYIVASLGAESGEVPYTAFSALKNYMDKNPDTIEAFLRAVFKGRQFIKDSKVEDIVAALKPSFDFSNELLTNIVERYSGIDAWSSTPVMTKGSFDKLLDIMDNAGELTERVDFEKIVDNSFAKKVEQELGLTA